MVEPRLTSRGDELGINGVLERLWLLGFLGRTIHVRPGKTDRTHRDAGLLRRPAR